MSSFYCILLLLLTFETFVFAKDCEHDDNLVNELSVLDFHELIGCVSDFDQNPVLYCSHVKIPPNYGLDTIKCSLYKAAVDKFNFNHAEYHRNIVSDVIRMNE